MATSHGTEWLETAKDKLVFELNALVTSMPTDGVSPLFSYVYEWHAVAKMQFNSVSIDFDSMDGGEPTGTNDKFLRWLPVFSIRVHTDLEDGINDTQMQMRLLNSITEKLHLNHDLAGGYRIQGVDGHAVGELFSESDSYGGHLNVTVSIDVEYVQE